jgi:hypothetical protein
MSAYHALTRFSADVATFMPPGLLVPEVKRLPTAAPRVPAGIFSELRRLHQGEDTDLRCR